MRWFLLFLFCASIARAETIIPGGDVSGVWNAAGSPYRVTFHTTVPAGDTLFVEEGVVVRFDDPMGLFVAGNLQAISTTAGGIRFTSADSLSAWRGIVIGSAAGDTIRLEGVRLDHANASSPLTLGYLTRTVLRRCTFADNMSYDRGGAISATGAWFEATDCLFRNNTSMMEGGAVNMTMGGGAVPVLRGCTFVDNHASLGGALSIDDSPVLVENCLFWANTTGQVLIYYANPAMVFRNCLVQGGTSGFLGTPPTNTDMQTGDPLFLGTGDHPFKPDWRSPCVNNGYAATVIEVGELDLAGVPRLHADPVNARVDIGCYEFQSDALRGSLTADAMLGDTLLLLGDVSVPNGITLAFEPDAYVLASGHHQFNVQGRLLAVGNESQPVTFAAADTVAGWGGFHFDHTPATNDTSRIEHCRVVHARAPGTPDWMGGGVFVDTFNKLVVSASVFDRCSGTGGAAYWASSSRSDFQNNLLLDCQGYINGGMGSLVWLNGGSGLSIVRGNRIEGGSGEGIKLGGAAALVQDNVIEGQGGVNDGFSVLGSESVVLERNFVMDCQTGLVVNYSTGLDLQLRNNILSDNGAGIFVFIFDVWEIPQPIRLTGDVISGSGQSGLQVMNMSYEHRLGFELTNCTLSGNGMHGLETDYTDLVLHNCVLWGNGGAALDVSQGSVSVDHCLLPGDANDIGGYSHTVPVFVGNLDIDPLFTGLEPHPYALAAGSPCINYAPVDTTGLNLPALDAAGSPRIHAGLLHDRLDIGAYEFVGDRYQIHVDSDWDKDTIYVADDVDVLAGVTLTIHPGTVVQALGPHAITVHGRLLAEGAEGDSLLFTALDPMEGWRGLRFIGGEDAGAESRLSFCAIERGRVEGEGDAGRGGLLFLRDYPSLLVSDCALRGGEAESGGLIAARGAGASLRLDRFSLSDGRATGLAPAGLGGLLQVDEGASVWARSGFLQDGEARLGGLVQADGAELTLINGLLRGGSASEAGGALDVAGFAPVLTQLTVVENEAPVAGALRASNDADPRLRGCILWSNGDSPMVALADGSVPVMSNCDVQGGWPGTQMVDADPRFVDAAAGDWTPLSSSCLNYGPADTSGLELPSQDLAGRARVYVHDMVGSDRLDQGAYEYQGLTPLVVQASDGDNNYPGYVRIDFGVRSGYMPLSGYRVERNGQLVYNAGPTTVFWNDDTALPGTVYSYRVVAEAGNEESEGEDSGYIKPNGVVTGTVLTVRNNPVENVRVSLDPSPGTSLQFPGTGWVTIENPLPDADASFTIELWMKSTATVCNLLRRCGQAFLTDGLGRLAYNDGQMVVQREGTPAVNDGAWHHVAFVYDSGEGRRRLYADGRLVADTLLALSSNPCEEMEAGFWSSCKLDELRIWSGVRDSLQLATWSSLIVPWDADGLLGYWPFNEGVGTIAFDGTNGTRNGVLSAPWGPEWSTDQPGILLAGFTDEQGEYVINQINYGASTTFTATPSRPGHVFLPEQRQVTLSTSSISQDNVDFTDNSLIPISGRVVWQDTDCGIEDAEILVGGESASPPTYTDGNGDFVLEVEHGTVCVLSASWQEHLFDREWELGTVVSPADGVDFADVTRTALRVEVVGGPDAWPIGAFALRLASLDECFVQEIAETDYVWSSGGVCISNLPPLDYMVTVTPGADDAFGLLADPLFLSQRSDSISLSAAAPEGDTLRFVWRAPLEARVEWPAELRYATIEGDSVVHPVEQHAFAEYPDSLFYVLPQNEWCEVRIRAVEDYGWAEHPVQLSLLETCEIRIDDEVGGTGTVEGSFPDTTVAAYAFAPYIPNMTAGTSRQYQNLLRVTLTDPDLERSATRSDWVLIEGERALESTFATVSPEIPLLVLHDPPGDGSFASFTETSATATTTKFSFGLGIDASAYLKLKLGHNRDYKIFGKGVTIETTRDLSLTISAGYSQAWADEQTITLTTTEAFSTSADDQVIGAGADLYVGGAMNLLFGVTQVLDWVDSLNTVAIDSSLLLMPDGFATNYVYTENQILNTVVPNLILIGDTTSAALWTGIVAANAANREDPVPNENHPFNISFNAGAGYSYEEATTTDSTTSVTWEAYLGGGVGYVAGRTLNGFGYEAGITVNVRAEWGGSTDVLHSNTTAIRYELADDDETSPLNELADYFTVDVEKDPVYGTPVFQLVSGVSSCPWEPGTQPRDGVFLTSSSYTASDVPEGQPAAFVLTLGNTSQSGEDRRTALSVDQASNPGGCLVRINGVPVEDQLVFDLPGGGAEQAILTVEPGPFSWEAEGLTVRLSSICEGGEGPEGHYFSMEKAFDITWEAPYSRVAILTPETDWLVNQASHDTLSVALSGYDLDRGRFQGLQLLYRRPPQGAWLPGTFIGAAELAAHPTSVTLPWNVAPLADGLYQLRAAALDSLRVPFVSTALAGRIDRAGPELLGEPEPADGILGPGDAICVPFTEWIDGLALHPDSVTVTVARTGQALDLDLDVFENTLTILPTLANYWIENELLIARVNGVPDLWGNAGDDVLWEFLVDRNPVAWDDTRLTAVKTLGEPLTLSAWLYNSGGQQSSFTIADCPSWLSPMPAAGTLSPQDGQLVEFVVDDELGFGGHQDTLYADVPGLGREPLIVSVSVLADAPAWASTLPQGYDHTMSLVAVLETGDGLSADARDVVGAFIEGEGGVWECRGAAPIEHLGWLPPETAHPWQAFLTVHSDAESGEEIRFRVWDASDCMEYVEVAESCSFEADVLHGSPLEPDTLSVTGRLSQEIALTSGWSWLSLNLIDPLDMTPDRVLAELPSQTGDLIKSQSAFAQYAEGLGWPGSLDTLATGDGYKLRRQAAGELVWTGFLGEPAEHPLPVAAGWNWLGYLPHLSLGVNSALAGLDGSATGDLIKSQSAFAVYVEGWGWQGSLVFMEPGKAYLLRAAQSGELVYPSWSPALAREIVAPPESAALDDPPDWSVEPEAFEYTASVTCALRVDGEPPAGGAWMVGAFAGEECRGSSLPQLVAGEWIAFLTVHSNLAGEAIETRVFLDASGETLVADETLLFADNAVIGTPLDPFLLHAWSAPAAPAGLTIALLPEESGLRLEWDASPNATGYRVEAAPAWGGVFVDATAEGLLAPSATAREDGRWSWTAPVAASELRLLRVVALRGEEADAGRIAVPVALPDVRRASGEKEEALE